MNGYNNTFSKNTSPNKKLCQIAKSRFGNITQKKENNMVEGAFMDLLKQSKKLLTQPKLIYFERDERKDASHSMFTMHTFLCKSFYVHLECSITYNFLVEFAFNNCPHETQIRGLLSCYALQGKIKERAFQPDFNTFYSAVLAFQDKRFIYSL